jgi:hypothetical protein
MVETVTPFSICGLSGGQMAILQTGDSPSLASVDLDEHESMEMD